MIGRRIQIAIASLIRCVLAYVRLSYVAADATWVGKVVYTMPPGDAVNARFNDPCRID